MNKKLVIGVGVAATLVAAYFVWKKTTTDKAEGEVFSGETPDVKVVTCKFPMLKCPNNPNKCYNPLIFGENQCA